MANVDDHPAQPRPEDQRPVGVMKRNITTGFILSVTALVAINIFAYCSGELHRVPPRLYPAVQVVTAVSYFLCFLAPVALVLCIRDRRRYRSMGPLLGIMASLLVTCNLPTLIARLVRDMMQVLAP